MTKQTAKINWKQYIPEQAQKTMSSYPERALNYPEIVEIDSYNGDGTITVIIGYNDFGTPMVVRIALTSEFVSELGEAAERTENPTAWKQYSKRMVQRHESTIMVVADERFGDTWVFTPDELPSHLVHCSIAFGDWDEEADQAFRDAIEELDLSDEHGLEEFEFHKDYIMKNECWSGEAEQIIKKFVKS